MAEVYAQLRRAVKEKRSAGIRSNLGHQKQILQQQYQTDTRQQTVQSELDRRNNDLIPADRELYYINVDLTRLQSATPKDDDATKSKTPERDAKAVEKQAITDRISSLNSELTTLEMIAERRLIMSMAERLFDLRNSALPRG